MSNPDSDPAWWFRNHGPKLIAFARQWAPCRADAEDIFQEAFVRFWQSRDSARQPLVYLYSCIRNSALNWIRARSRRQHHEQAADWAREDRQPSPTLEQTERHHQIERAMAQLPQELREVVALKVWSEMTFDEIAGVLSIPRSSAHALYSRAMKQLQAALHQEMPS